MSRKFLCLIIFVMAISIGVVSASENLTNDVVSVENEISLESIDYSKEAVLTDDYDDEDYDDFDDYDRYYDKAVLKPTKLTTNYNSGKTFNVKAVSAQDSSYPLEDIKLKLRVFTKGSYKDYYAYTNHNGIAKFKVSHISIGTHKVHVSSSDSYTSAKKVTSTVKINKANTYVSAPKVTAKQGQSKKYKITIYDKSSYNPLKNVKISVKVGNKKYSLKTYSNGAASFNTKSFKPGTYAVTIKSADSKYKVYAKSSIVIKKVAKKTTTSNKKSTSSYSSGGSYVASKNSNKFHYPSCSAAKRIKSYNKIYFSSRNQAFNSGYSSCGICHP